MNEDRAIEILGDWIVEQDESLSDPCRVEWPGDGYEDHVDLGGLFTADQLEAIAWWMRNKRQKP